MNSMLFEPDDNSERHLLGELCGILSYAEMDAKRIEALAAICQNTLTEAGLSDDDVLFFVQQSVNATKNYPNTPESFLTLLLSKCLGYGPAHINLPIPSSLAEKVAEFGQSIGIDLGKGLVETVKKHLATPRNVEYRFRHLAKYLFEKDLIDLGSVIYLKTIIQRVDDGIEFRKSRETNILNPEEFGFWLDLYTLPNETASASLTHIYDVDVSNIQRVLEKFFQEVLCALPDDQIGKVAMAVTFEIDEWLKIKFSYVYDRTNPEWSWLASSLYPYFCLIADRIKTDANDTYLQWSYFRYGWRSLWPEVNKSSKLETKTIIESCNQFYGHLRVLLKSSDTTTETEVARHSFKIGSDVNYCLLACGGVWPVVKHLLQSLRSVSVASVANDLRYWNEPLQDEQPPEPWNWIPTRIAGILHNFAGLEQESDAELKKLRSEFADYCLQRLKTKKGVSKSPDELTNEDLIEPSPIWRDAYIHAIRALRVNPSGSSHHILYFSKNSDPDTAVRKAAKIAYKEIRHEVSLPYNMSAKTPLFAAVWWLRQAHYVSLMGTDRLDKRGAQRTYYKEVRRTKEKS
jgi:hypothetical protein